MIVAFTGLKGHGKTTAARTLEAAGFRHINFADPVREVVHVVYGVSYHEMNDPLLKEMKLDRWPYKSPRDLMKQVGTEMFRAYIPETWTECFERSVQQANDEGVFNIVCSDLRFPNEAEYLNGRDAFLVRIHNPQVPEVADLHESERYSATMPVDLTIRNDDSIEALQRRVAGYFLVD